VRRRSGRRPPRKERQGRELIERQFAQIAATEPTRGLTRGDYNIEGQPRAEGRHGMAAEIHEIIRRRKILVQKFSKNVPTHHPRRLGALRVSVKDSEVHGARTRGGEGGVSPTDQFCLTIINISMKL
jgi:hypothetical protein